eukprot:302701_1
MPSDHVPIGANPNNKFYTINGKYLPTIQLVTGIWRKFRLLHVDADNDQEFEIGHQCSVYLLARDGVLVHGLNNEVPRQLVTNKIFLDVSQRADIAVSCTEAGIYDFKAGNQLIATIQVNGFSNPAPMLTTFNPLRPDYLTPLVNYNGPFQLYPGNGPQTYDYLSLNLGARTINGNQFVSS